MTAKQEDDLEFEVGQNWFAFAGILALTLGGGFLVVLPHPTLPPALPSVLGYAAVAVLFGVSHLGRKAFESVSRSLQGAAMALCFVATLRLFFPAPRNILDAHSLVGQAILLTALGINGLLAWRQNSPWLAAMALATCAATALFVGSAGFVLTILLATALFAVRISYRAKSPGLLLGAMPLAFGTYLLWAMGNPLRGGVYQFVTEPIWAPGSLLALIGVFALGSLRRLPPNTPEDGICNSSVLVNCALGFGIFLIHTVAAHSTYFAANHLIASVLLLALAMAYWRRLNSRIATFFYAMTGYAALTLAIVKTSASPGVFVWLSLQSLVVVATAVWFRSRFIVVANFVIYVAIVLGYVFVSKGESGISVGFGAVALVTARFLNWQQHRLELKTELMRNAYLLSAFIVFPYALFHLVPSRQVGLAWVGLALGYYGLNWVFKNRKYRWMGHATLLLTTCYLVVVGTRTFDPLFRVLSFLVLGTVLLVVSMVFTQLRKRQRTTQTIPPAPGI
jgi:hypothetical protein